jgi:pimeloyl-ACP methyl ester carboxylesterase
VRESFTARSGVRIRYLDNSPSDPVGLPILLSPGFTDQADEYVEVLDFFSPRRVLVVEVRGRGGSESPPSGYTAADHADDLRAVLDEEGVDRFHAMTFSRGTTWALDLVLADPGRAASVCIGDYWPREHALSATMAEQVMAGRFRGKPLADRVEPHVIPSLFAASVDRDLHDPLAATGPPGAGRHRHRTGLHPRRRLDRRVPRPDPGRRGRDDRRRVARPVPARSARVPPSRGRLHRSPSSGPLIRSSG